MNESEVLRCLFQDGEIVYVDWMPAKDQESGKIQSKSQKDVVLSTVLVLKYFFSSLCLLSMNLYWCSTQYCTCTEVLLLFVLVVNEFVLAKKQLY